MPFPSCSGSKVSRNVYLSVQPPKVIAKVLNVKVKRQMHWTEKKQEARLWLVHVPLA